MNTKLMEPIIYILLPVHNRKAITTAFVDRLKKQCKSCFKLILIDDGSTDGTSEMVTSQLPAEQLEILKGDGNLWWAGALQKGYEYLKSLKAFKPTDIVLIINDDTIMPEGFLKKAINKINTLPPRQLLFAVNKDPENQRPPEGGICVDWLRLKFDAVMDQQKINCASTRGLFIKGADYLEIGSFRPKWLPHYTSDYEYTIRAVRKGFQIVSDEDIYIDVDFNSTANLPLNFDQPYNDFIGLFLKKYVPSNIWMTSKFILLSAPWYYVPHNLVRVWGGLFKYSYKYFSYHLSRT